MIKISDETAGEMVDCAIKYVEGCEAGDADAINHLIEVYDMYKKSGYEHHVAKDNAWQLAQYIRRNRKVSKKHRPLRIDVEVIGD